MPILTIDMSGLTHKVILTHISRPGGMVLRTKEVRGWTKYLPEVGLPFILLGEPLEKGMGLRRVNTSEVVGLEVAGDTYMLKTKTGSVYQVISERMVGDS